ncbi:MAG TPA: AI-2E family transporter, partial [bacterium]|nr:AI-2E family transporter [bacterium]
MRKAFLVLFAAMTALFVVICWPFAKPAFLAFTLAVIFHPLQRFAAGKLKLPRYIAAVLTTAVVAVCVIFPLAVLVGVVVTQAGHFLQGASAEVQSGSFSDSLGQLILGLHDWIERLWGSAPPIEELKASLMSGMQEAARWLYEFSPRVLVTTLSVLVNFVLMLLFLVVFLAEGTRLYSFVMESTPLSDSHRVELARDVRLTIVTSIAAAVIIAVVQGGLLGMGFWVAGFSQPIGWGLIAMILSVIPVIGASSCYVAATLLLLAAGNVK